MSNQGFKPSAVRCRFSWNIFVFLTVFSIHIGLCVNFHRDFRADVFAQGISGNDDQNVSTFKNSAPKEIHSVLLSDSSNTIPAVTPATSRSGGNSVTGQPEMVTYHASLTPPPPLKPAAAAPLPVPIRASTTFSGTLPRQAAQDGVKNSTKTSPPLQNPNSVLVAQNGVPQNGTKNTVGQDMTSFAPPPQASEKPLAKTVHQLSIIDTRTEDAIKASVSAKTRDEIIRKIPLRQMPAASRQKVQDVLSNITMYRRLPLQTITSEEDIYQFLCRHPDIVVNIWEVMKVGQIQLKELDENRFFLEDNAGTRGIIECLHRGENLQVIYVSGSYEGIPFPSKVHGQGVLILQQEPMADAHGEPRLAIRVDSFIHIQNGAVDFLAKTFQSPVGKIADNNNQQIVGFVGALSRTMWHNSENVRQVAPMLTRVRPEVRREFAELTGKVADRMVIKIFEEMVPVAGGAEGEWK